MRVLTPPSLAGVAVFAVRLDEIRGAGVELVTRAGHRVTPSMGAIRLATLVLHGRALDEVLVLLRHDGEVELHTHGAPAVVDAMQAAFRVDRRSLAPAEQMLREAMSVEQFDCAAEQLRWEFDAELARIQAMPREWGEIELQAARARSRIAMALRCPAPVVLVGAQNAGKSALFNRLLLRERSLSGPTAGLTRDPVRECTVLAGYPYELIDTAGECLQNVGVIDDRAIAAGRELRREGLVILIVDASCGPSRLDRQLLALADVVIASKCDLPSAPWPDAFPCHARVSVAESLADSLRATFGALLRAARGLPAAGPLGGFAALQAEDLRRLST